MEIGFPPSSVSSQVMPFSGEGIAMVFSDFSLSFPELMPLDELVVLHAEITVIDNKMRANVFNVFIISMFNGMHC